MASLWVTELDAGTPNGMQVSNGNVITVQKITISTTSAKAVALNERTKLVELFADAACCFKFAAGDTSAAVTDRPLAAESPLYVAAKQGDIIAAITR